MVLSAGLCLALALTFLVGCSPQKHYKVLSFFFDGVTDPNAPPKSESEQEVDATGTPIKVVAYNHKPYADGKCDVCHAGADANNFASFQKVGNNVCLKCHVETLTQYPVMHGPVVSLECLLCHQPHESTIKGMLNAEAPQVCIQCHDRDLLSANPPEHLIENSPCLKCHVAHGGHKHNLLRADALPAPAKKPATAPANPAVPSPAAPTAAPVAPTAPGAAPANPTPAPPTRGVRS